MSDNGQQNVKRLEGSGQMLPEGLVDKLNETITAAVTELVELVPSQNKPLIGGIIGRMSAKLLQDYKNHVAVHGFER